MKVQCMEFLEVFLLFFLSIFPPPLSLFDFFLLLFFHYHFPLVCPTLFLFWQCQGISSVKGNWKHSFTCWTGWVSESWAGYSPLPDQNEVHAHSEQYLVLLSSMFGNNHHHHQHLWNDQSFLMYTRNPEICSLVQFGYFPQGRGGGGKRGCVCVRERERGVGGVRGSRQMGWHRHWLREREVEGREIGWSSERASEIFSTLS